jgi:hypothetical protein
MRLSAFHGRLGLSHLQLVLAATVLLTVVLAPPARGAILIVSFGNEDAGAIARWAIGHGAKPLGAGPVPNSLVVEGSRAALGWAAIERGSVLLTGIFAGCGRAI